MKDIHDSFEIEISDELYEVNLRELIAELKIDSVDIGEDVRTQPGLFAWVATLASQADYDAGRSKQKLAALRAAFAKSLHADNEGKGRNDRMTVDAIDSTVTTDPSIMDAVDEYLELARRAAILAGMREAFRQRKDMLNILGYGTRQREQAET